MRQSQAHEMSEFQHGGPKPPGKPPRNTARREREEGSQEAATAKDKPVPVTDPRTQQSHFEERQASWEHEKGPVPVEAEFDRSTQKRSSQFVSAKLRRSLAVRRPIRRKKGGQSADGDDRNPSYEAQAGDSDESLSPATIRWLTASDDPGYKI